MFILDAPKAPESLKIPTLIGVMVLLFGLLGFLLWSVSTPLDSAVVAQGVVKVGSEKKQVQHLEGGIVKGLFVKEGDHVEQGSTLLTLDETFAGTDLSILSNQQQELSIREALLIAQRDAHDAITFEDSGFSKMQSDSFAEQRRSAEQLFELSRSSLNSQLATLDAQGEQLRKKVEGYGREIEAKVDQVTFMEEELSAWDNLVQRKYANKLRYLELKGKLSELKAELAQLETQKVSAESQIEEIQFESERVENSFRENAATELAEVQLKINDLSKRIASASNVLGRIDIKAPVSGKVVGLNIYTIGAVIRPGETILEIVPTKDELVVSAQVRPVDIDKVQQFMEARIRLSSYKQHEFPEFDGVVESVSADVFEDPNTKTNYFRARIGIPKETFAQIEPGKVNPGMPAEVMIITGESTPAQYLMEPLLNAFRTAWRDS